MPYQDCVAFCSADFFYEGQTLLMIDPEECIDYGRCVPECSAEAIYAEADLPAKNQALTALNRQLGAAWPEVAVRSEVPADADKWKNVEGKLTGNRKFKHPMRRVCQPEIRSATAIGPNFFPPRRRSRPGWQVPRCQVPDDLPEVNPPMFSSRQKWSEAAIDVSGACSP